MLNQVTERLVRSLLALVCASAVACGGDGGTGPSQGFESIAGSYAGPITGLAQGTALDASVIVMLNQTAGEVSGSYSMSGIVTDGFTSAEIEGTGIITGNVQPGVNPSVSLAVTSADCPNVTANFSGAFDSVNRRLTVSGPVYVFDEFCGIALAYQITLLLVP